MQADCRKTSDPAHLPDGKGPRAVIWLYTALHALWLQLIPGQSSQRVTQLAQANALGFEIRLHQGLSMTCRQGIGS